MRVLTLAGCGLLVLSVVLMQSGEQRHAPAPHTSLTSTEKISTENFSPADSRLLRLAGQSAAPSKEHGEDLYTSKCSMCHQPDLKGMAPVFPSLIGVTDRVSDADIANQIKNGKGKMPPVPGVSDDDIKSIILFLKAPPAKPAGLDAIREATQRM